MARVDCHCLGVFTQNLNALLTSILLFLRKIDTGPLIFSLSRLTLPHVQSVQTVQTVQS